MKRKLSSKDRRRLLWGIMWAFYEAVCEELSLDPHDKGSQKVFIFVVKKFIREGAIPKKKAVKKITKRDVDDIMKFRYDTSSLNLPVGEDDLTEIGDLLTSPHNVVDDVHEIMLREKIRHILESDILTTEGRTYIKMRYGFDCDPVGDELIRKELNVNRGKFSSIVRRTTFSLRDVLNREGLDEVH